jgi:hypothetical protein
VPRREMLDAPFASLEADYVAALGKRHLQRQPSTPRPGGRRRRPGVTERV